jgi:glycosyltransferase involved in cell wall biosynthesis
MTNGLLIIPAYNEEKNIISVLEEIKSYNFDLDMVVVNDGSKDNTGALIKKMGINSISHPYNLGYGAALQTGFKYAKQWDYDYVIIFDSDGQHDPKNLITMINEISKGQIDIVTGSRFLELPFPQVDILKLSVMKLLRLIIKSTTGVKVTDPTCGLKALSKKTYNYYSNMGNYPADFPDADIIIKMLKLGYTIKEIPVNIRERKYGTSMHSGLKPIIYLMKMFLSIIIVLLSSKFIKENSL